MAFFFDQPETQRASPGEVVLQRGHQLGVDRPARHGNRPHDGANPRNDSVSTRA